ncbi:hypothetical protein NBRC10513_007118 [Rhodotorula toruloides]
MRERQSLLLLETGKWSGDATRSAGKRAAVCCADQLSESACGTARRRPRLRAVGGTWSNLGFLPPSHFGGRRRRSAEDAVVCVIDEIKGQWRNGNAVVGLALDVSKAFPSVRTDRLTANLKSRGLPNSACAWIESFLSDRTCTLQLEGVVSNPIAWTSGLPQGSPLLPILFLSYTTRPYSSPAKQRRRAVLDGSTM